MKRFALFSSAVFFLLSLLLSGCTEIESFPLQKEMDMYSMVRLITIDRAENGMMRMGAFTVDEVGKNGGMNGESGESPVFLVSEQESLAQAEKELQQKFKKTLYWNHVDYYIIGEEAARDDLSKYTDYVLRNIMFRSSASVYVTGGAASDFVEASLDLPFTVAEYLDNATASEETMNRTSILTLIDMVIAENDPHGATAVPMIALDGEDIILSGYGIVKGFVLLDFINMDTGYNYLTDEVHTDAIAVHMPDGDFVELNVKESATKISPLVTNGALEGIDIVCSVKSSINELHAPFFFDAESIISLEDEQRKHIIEEITGAIETIQTLNADTIGFWKNIWVRHPLLWEGLTGDWDKIFPDLPVHITVNSHVERVFDLTEYNRRG